MVTKETVRQKFQYREDGELLYNTKTCFNNIGNVAGSFRNDGRKEVWCVNKLYLVHRLIYLWHHGKLPDLVDHIDRDYSNNRIENLREATKSQNNHNSSITKSRSGFRGVVYEAHARKYRARITIEGKTFHIGYFDTAIEASNAYEETRKKLVNNVSRR